MMRRVNILCSFALLFASHTSLAVTYPLPPEGSRLVGQSLTVTVPDHNTQPLETFAAQYGQGLSNMLEANPGADVFLPKSGSHSPFRSNCILPALFVKGLWLTSLRCVFITTHQTVILWKSFLLVSARLGEKPRVTG